MYNLVKELRAEYLLYSSPGPYMLTVRLPTVDAIVYAQVCVCMQLCN
jgi:hypothetical protein